MIQTSNIQDLTLQATVKKRKQLDYADGNGWTSKTVRYVFMLLIIGLPWAYGGVQFWAQHWTAVGLLVCLTLWWYESVQAKEKSQTIPIISWLLVGGILMGLFQLWPVPEFLAKTILGRQLEIYQNFSVQPGSRATASLFAEGTLHQLQLLLLALVSLMVAARYFRRTQDVVTLLAVIVVNGALLAMLGMIEKLLGETLLTFSGNNYSTFVNRNNAGGYLLMTLSAAVGLLPIVMSRRNSTGPERLISREMPYWRQLSQFITGQIAELNAAKISLLLSLIIIIAGIIASLSRGASLSLVVGMSVTIVSYGMARRPKALSVLVVPLVGLVMLLSAWVGFSERLMERWQRTELVEVSRFDARVQNWRATLPVIQEMGIFGAGLGSYRHVHRLYNEDNERVIFEFAENQFFQALVEAGPLGLGLFLAAWVLGFFYSFQLLNQAQSDVPIGIGTLGIFLFSSQAVASLFDFGLYIPANLVLMAALTGTVAYRAQALMRKIRKDHWASGRYSMWLVQIYLLCMFGGLTMTAINLNRHWLINQQVRIDRGEWNPNSLGLSQTDRKIDRMESLIQRSPTIEGLNHLSDLWIHRFRLMAFEGVINTPEYRNRFLIADEKEQVSLPEEAWDSTRPERVRDYIQNLNNDGLTLRARSFVNEPAFTDNLPRALQLFSFSRDRAPLQPYVHLRLGQLSGLRNDPVEEQKGAESIERAIQLAPGNTDFRVLGGLYYIQGGRLDLAATHLKRYLELDRSGLTLVMQILTGQTGYSSNQVSLNQILDTILPDNPRMLYQFATRWADSEEETRRRALEKAENLIPTISGTQLEKLAILANIQIAKSETELAIETMESILMGNPLDEQTRFRLAGMLLAEKRLPEAQKHSEILVRSNRTNTSYTNLHRRIQLEIRKLDEQKSPLNL